MYNTRIQTGGWNPNNDKWNCTVEGDAIDVLFDRMVELGAGAGQIVAEEIQTEGAHLIKNAILPLIHHSGRRWKKKVSPLISPNQFSQDDEDVGVTIAARGRLHYYYFPDDGSNTHKHAGNQQFMYRGAVSVQDRIIDNCLGVLIKRFEN